jgi:hypothetical protein
MVKNAITKIPKEERRELKRTLESMEEKWDSPEFTISIMRNSNTEIPSTNPDEQPPMEHFDKEAEGDFPETMM